MAFEAMFIRGAVVAKRGSFEVLPNAFVRVELVGVRRQVLRYEPRVCPEPVFDKPAAVSADVIPENDDPVRNVAQQGRQEAQHLLALDTAAYQMQVQPSTTSDVGNGRELGPTERTTDDRRLAAPAPAFTVLCSSRSPSAKESSSHFGSISQLNVTPHVSGIVALRHAEIDAPRTALGTVPGTVRRAVLIGVSGWTFPAILRAVCTAIAGLCWKVTCGWTLAATADTISQPIRIAARRMNRNANCRETCGRTCRWTCSATSMASCRSKQKEGTPLRILLCPGSVSVSICVPL